MADTHPQYVGTQNTSGGRLVGILRTNMLSPITSDEEAMADADEPPDNIHTGHPYAKLPVASKAPFAKSLLVQNDRKTSLLTNALLSPDHSPTEEHSETTALTRGLSCASTWSNNSAASTAELTSDGGFTSPGTRASTPSPPPPSSTFRGMVPIFNKKPFDRAVSIVRHEDDNIGPLQKAPLLVSGPGEDKVEVSLGRKRCITFACGQKETPKPAPNTSQAKVESTAEPPKRVSTIKFACPAKVSTEAPCQKNKPRRPASPAPKAFRPQGSPNINKVHRGSDSTVRNASPVSVRKLRSAAPTRRTSISSELAKNEAFRFHEFASSTEEVDQWIQEPRIHKSRLTVSDTLKVENTLRLLGQEAEEEAIEEEDEQDELDGEDDDEDLDDEDEDDENVDETYGDVSDAGFQTDDEGGLSDDDSDTGSDYHWWAPGHSTAATSIEHLEQMRLSVPRTLSVSSIESLSSVRGFAKRLDRTPRPKKSRPVNIRPSSPELPDSTDFVCGTLDEDRPLEDAYLVNLARRRAAKHKVTPQDIDPTFPTSDPEMDEEDDDEEADHVEESDHHVMVLGQMDPVQDERRGRRIEVPKKRSPAQSPRRLRSPPPPAKRPANRSPPGRLFGNSPRRLRSPPPARLRSPPPTRRGSDMVFPNRPAPLVHFAGLAHRDHVTLSTSLPRARAVPCGASDNDDSSHELPTRRAIDIKVGLEQKRMRRRTQLYAKYHRKACKGKEKDKRPPPGKGFERMRDVGLGLAAHKGKTATAFADLLAPPALDQKDTYILSV